jgi:hypothetical protein
MDPDATHPLGLATAGPRIIQLSPIPGNIYNADCFYYDPAANFLVAILGLSWHSLQLTAALSLSTTARIFMSFRRPTLLLSSALSTRFPWLSLLGNLPQAGSLAPPAFAQHPPAVAAVATPAGDPQFILQTAPSTSVGNDTPSVGSSFLLSYESFPCGGGGPFCWGSPFSFH